MSSYDTRLLAVESKLAALSRKGKKGKYSIPLMKPNQVWLLGPGLKPCYVVQLANGKLGMIHNGISPTGDSGFRNKHEITKWVDKTYPLATKLADNIEELITRSTL